LWTSIVFADEEFKIGSKIIAHFWFITVTESTLQNGLSLALRVLGFASLSLLFIFTTDKTELMLSLMQQCKLPPKFAYGILAGYRFLPQMKDEFQTIQNAHRIRGIKRATTLKDRIHQLKRYIIPLLASAIRKAERTALAMESKGFTGAKGRVFYKTTSIKKKDVIFLLSSFLVMAICYYAPKLFHFTF
jgi:energy-coupling factor transport system permease protein